MATVIGEVTYNTGTVLRERIKKAFDGPESEIVLDMSGVTFVDSTGIGTIIGLKSTCQAHNKRFLLVKLRGAVRDSFIAMRLDRVFQIEDQ